MEKQELIVVALVGIGGLVIGKEIGKRLEKKFYKNVENGVFILTAQVKELLAISKKATTENEILKAKIKEMGCL